MAPEQNQLSQEVLEFLIAHQDWFMLDIAPPASQTRPATQIEQDELEGEGWRLVDSAKVRRRASSATGSPTPASDATTSRATAAAAAAAAVAGGAAIGGGDDAVAASGSGVTVTRSKTLPPKASRGQHEQSRSHGVLRKKGLFGTSRDATAERRQPSS